MAAVVSTAPNAARQRAWLIALAVTPLFALVWTAGPGALMPGGKLGTAAGGVLVLLLATCTVTDVLWRKIYNWASYTAFVWGVLFNALAFMIDPTLGPQAGTVGLTASLLGALVAFFGMLVAYHLSGGGAGDVKLATAIGAWLGPYDALNMLVFTYAVGGVVLLSWSVWTQGPVKVFGSLLRRLGSTLLPGWVAAPSDEQSALLRQPVPMSPFFAAGTLAVLLGVRLS